MTDTLPDDLGRKLEDMVFGQLQNTDPYVDYIVHRSYLPNLQSRVMPESLSPNP
jgi:hypothetical protein